MLFGLNNKDYTAHIVADTYKVNLQPVYEHYEDAKGHTHNVRIRDRVSGSFDMFFKTIEEYDAFVKDFKDGKSPLNNAHTITLKPNTTNTEGLYLCFLKYEPTRRLNGQFKDFMGVFTISVEER